MSRVAGGGGGLQEGRPGAFAAAGIHGQPAGGRGGSWLKERGLDVLVINKTPARMQMAQGTGWAVADECRGRAEMSRTQGKGLF